MRLPDSLHAALVTAGFTFLSAFLSLILGPLDAGELPGTGTIRDALVSAAVAALAGLANWAFRAAQATTGVGKPPVYATQIPKRRRRRGEQLRAG